MENIQIIELMNNPQSISSNDVNYLDEILLKYPYFQIAQVLLSRGLLNIDSIRFNQQLKKSAAYALNREKLFHLITKENPINKNKDKTVEKENLDIGRPLIFEENESHSFSEWLTLLNIKKIQRKERKSIDRILSNNLQISKTKKEAFFNANDAAKESLIENYELVTPTLAKVYLEQGHYEKAISAYKKLILKYPEKNSFFANQIKLIRKLNTK